MTNQKSNPTDSTVRHVHSPNPQVTVSYDLVSPSCDFTIRFLIDVIKSEQYKKKVNTIQKLVMAGLKEGANQLKKNLPAATFSCQYKLRRSKDNVTAYNGFVLLDADNLCQSELVRVVAMLPSSPYVHASFISPSGNGIKILVRTNGLLQHHVYTYGEVLSYFERFLQIKFDACNTDVVRLCFLSHDPNAYYNPDAKVYNVAELVIAKEERPIQSHRYEIGDCQPRLSRPAAAFAIARNDKHAGDDSIDYLFRKSVRFTNRRRSFVEGNRNNFVFLLSCYCRQNGLSKEAAEDEILKHYNYSQREIKNAVKSAFSYK